MLKEKLTPSILLSKRELAKDRRLRKKYGLTLEQWKIMLWKQQGRCKICERSFMEKRRRAQTDHDHKTGRVRGLLCFRCNHRLLGKGLEISWLHRSAAAYLESDYDGRREGVSTEHARKEPMTP